MLAIVALAAIREKLWHSDVPAPLQGIGITFLCGRPNGLGLHVLLWRIFIGVGKVSETGIIVLGVVMFTVIVISLVAFILPLVPA